MIPVAAESFICLVDLQEKLAPAMSDPAGLLRHVRILLGGARALAIPFLAARQYPKGLGVIVPQAAELIPPGTPVTDKTSFSCFGSPEFTAAAAKLNRKQMLLLGVEAHICVLQTALDALDAGYKVYLASDCTDSRFAADKDAALSFLRRRGVEIVTGEMLLFALMRDAKHPAFKTVSALVR